MLEGSGGGDGAHAGIMKSALKVQDGVLHALDVRVHRLLVCVQLVELVDHVCSSGLLDSLDMLAVHRERLPLPCQGRLERVELALQSALLQLAEPQLGCGAVGWCAHGSALVAQPA